VNELLAKSGGVQGKSGGQEGWSRMSERTTGEVMWRRVDITIFSKKKKIASAAERSGV